ncbi:tyrosine-type recombinase/integrase [Aureimonas altamirensis]|uniref:tyrosine-type recombinase/integrase n=1 Tax=Aureimonas altamirensis TaxID=370622 RepID=UPI001E4868F2|nr:tyrosine-type recombinase/integrase [Aureimonas altamirensis]UHD44011.1 tyrosine-type recombinase/integrase [Aureimonas altamirensis]
MRLNLKGIARTWKTLSDGSRRRYIYAWRGGPLLRDDDGEPLQDGDPRLVKAYSDALASRKIAQADTLDTLIDEFMRSSEYTTKSDKSRKGYDLYIRRLREYRIGKAGLALTDLSIRAIQEPNARGLFKAWRDTMADERRTADYAWVTLARILSVAKDNGRISVNVCERGGRLYTADRAEKIWTADDIQAIMQHGSEPLRMAFLMALWTGQREGDLLRVPWSAYDGSRIRIRQGKTGARVSIPVGQPLKVALDAAAQSKKTTTILANTRGRSWTEDGFRASWGKACRSAGIEGLTFHDIRGTAVTRLALAGCSTSQIAAITGHALKDVEHILDAHYLGGRVELSEQAMAKLETQVGGL